MKKQPKREKHIPTALTVEQSMPFENIETTDNIPSPSHFETFFPWVCANYGCHLRPNVCLLKPESPVFLMSKCFKVPVTREKSKRDIIPMTSGRDLVHTSFEADHTPSVNVYVSYLEGNLSEIHFKGAEIPLLMLQCLGLCLEYTSLVKKLVFHNCTLSSAFIYELSIEVKKTKLTTLILDGCECLHSNYYCLLDTQSCLQTLSLRRCSINDAALKLLTANLEMSRPSAKVLRVLQLSSNHITDVGAESISSVLRTNRVLKVLSLADNRITDVGFFHILAALQRFPINYTELLWKRQRILAFFSRSPFPLTAEGPVPPARSNKSTPKAKKRGHGQAVTQTPNSGTGSDGSWRKLTKASGLVCYPVMFDETENYICFQPAETVYHEGDLQCVGNYALSYLDMAYNALTVISMRRVLALLEYQIVSKAVLPGLKMIILEGNPLRADCNEYIQILKLLEIKISLLN